MTTPSGQRQQERAELVKRLRDHENEGVTGSDRFHLREAAARLLEEDGREIERLEREAQRISFTAGNIGIEHPEWPPEYSKHLVALVDRAEKAEARVSELEQALEELGEAHRLLAAQGLMAACADEGKDQ
jgi:hypothetical protein